MRNPFHLSVLSLACASSAHAGIIFTVEAPGLQFSTRAGVLVETFDSLSNGALGAYNSVLGQYSAGGQIETNTPWGGSNQTPYAALGAQSGTTSYTLNFGRHITYFGLYWAAADWRNVLEFYDGATLVGSFGTADWADTLPASYFGNPNTGENTWEKYAFLNFDAIKGVKFDSVRFVNAVTDTGFETDSHTIYADAPVPEPATWAMIVGAAIVLGLAQKRRFV